MYQWSNKEEKIQGIQTILNLFFSEFQEFYGINNWELKFKSVNPIIFELTVDNLTKVITEEEISDTEQHILFTQFIVTRTKEELLYKALDKILIEKFELKKSTIK
ncbi:hypothetical protein [Paenibacillus glycanilyticus]|uniref:hypothetical protein n=1 Tax=Paenibacillus glycanilyticus TaxID=126569 RepID=UPI000FDA899A|nr:hypothetical protein [Paenibacillus glycanilyticus]